MLLLTHLTALPIDHMAREVGVTRASAERELQTASAQFAVHREVPSTAIRGVLEALAPGAGVGALAATLDRDAGRLGPPPRAHHRRRRGRASPPCWCPGSLVTDAAGVRPALETKGILEGTSTGPAQQERRRRRRRTRSPPRRCSASSR